jgi:hypothetical protein
MYTVTKVQLFDGSDGPGFTCELLRNGVKVARVHNAGDGGCHMFSWVTKADEANFEEFVKSLHPMQIDGETYIMDADLHVCYLVDAWALNRSKPRVPKLPDECFARMPGEKGIIKIVRGETGYYAITTTYTVDQLNAKLGVTPAQREAMVAGSMFGWDAPAANPDNYDERGVYVRVPTLKELEAGKL